MREFVCLNCGRIRYSSVELKTQSDTRCPYCGADIYEQSDRFLWRGSGEDSRFAPLDTGRTGD
ncbi:MAG: hypothetical protein GX111_04915 [Clostridiales bacterium]|nr:hypothetical protein [Clostridiales bacterium]